MLMTKKQEWILQMIKGPDITPVENSPGHYSLNSTICITADGQKVNIRPSDVLDLSNPDFLVIHGDDRACTIPWDRISNLDFEERQIPPAQQPQMRAAAHRLLHIPLGKKTV
jgi:hypothetical protein